MLQINSSIIDFIISGIISVIIGVILMKIVIWYAKLMGYIPDFKKKKNESSIIAEENNWKETSDFSDRLKIYRKKKVKWILLWILMTIPITIVSLVFFPI